jgi:hypothetical protein
MALEIQVLAVNQRLFDDNELWTLFELIKYVFAHTVKTLQKGTSITGVMSAVAETPKSPKMKFKAAAALFMNASKTSKVDMSNTDNRQLFELAEHSLAVLSGVLRAAAGAGALQTMLEEHKKLIDSILRWVWL